jgi:hypothetical protein
MTLDNHTTWKKYLSDIRFWIVLLFALRLYGITNPPLETTSAVRQVDVLMVARNLYEIDPNIFYPMVDWNGKTEVAGSEFPILNYLIYLMSLMFGFANWYGRLINLTISSIAAKCFYEVISRYFGKVAGFNSTFILLFSAWLSYARVGIPDIFAPSLCIISLYFSFQYFEQGRYKDLLLFIILGSLGCLSKISAASLLTVLIVPMASKDFLLSRKIVMIFSGGVILSLVCLWYFYWVPYLNSVGNPTYWFMGMPFSRGIQEFLQAPNLFFDKVYDDALKYVGGLLALFSIVYAVRLKKFGAVVCFLAPFIAFSIFVLKSGKYFYINGYYFVMLVPFMAFIAGVGLSLLRNRTVQLLILSVIAMENIASQYHYFRVGGPYAPLTKLEGIFNDIGSQQTDLIAAGSDTTMPSTLHMSHRRGWMVSNETLKDPGEVQSMKSRGCRYLLILKKINSEDLTLPYQLVHDSDDFKIYRL